MLETSPGVPMPHIGTLRGFAGIYSGRYNKDEERVQLGIVWQKAVIHEIIEGKVLGNIDFQKI